MKDWNECVNISRWKNKKIFKNLSLSWNSLNLLLQNLQKEYLFTYIFGIINFVFFLTDVAPI